MENLTKIKFDFYLENNNINDMSVGAQQVAVLILDKLQILKREFNLECEKLISYFTKTYTFEFKNLIEDVNFEQIISTINDVVVEKDLKKDSLKYLEVFVETFEQCQESENSKEIISNFIEKDEKKKNEVVKQQVLKSVDDIQSMKTIRNFLITNVLVTFTLFLCFILSSISNGAFGIYGHYSSLYVLSYYYRVFWPVFVFGTISMFVIGILILAKQKNLKEFKGIVITSGWLSIYCIFGNLSYFVWIPTFIVSLIALISIQKYIKK